MGGVFGGGVYWEETGNFLASGETLPQPTPCPDPPSRENPESVA